jgi:Cu(I)-responsive transcriptional regulator
MSVSYPMNIGEAAQAAGLTPKMIRDYEALGLIPQASRTENGYRQYTKRDVDMLRFIRQARSMSFSIKQVEQLLSLWSDSERESSDVKALAQAQMAELDRKIAELASSFPRCPRFRAARGALTRCSTTCGATCGRGSAWRTWPPRLP